MCFWLNYSVVSLCTLLRRQTHVLSWLRTGEGNPSHRPQCHWAQIWTETKKGGSSSPSITQKTNLDQTPHSHFIYVPLYPSPLPLFLHLCVLLIRVSHKTQNVSDRAPNGAYAVSICGDSWKISDFYLHFWPDASRFSILAFLEGKTAPKRWKIWVFQNWLDTRPKIKMQDPNVCSIILGGVSRRFWNPLLDLGARSALFWHFWGAFGQNTSPTLQCV